jgi:topoisomerase-4 subunit A
MLVFPVKELPELSKGKGNKIIQIPAPRARAREELLMYLTLLPAGWHLTIHAGKRQLKLKPGNLVEYQGARGRRGRKLPRGFRNVDRVEVEEPAQMEIM